MTHFTSQSPGGKRRGRPPKYRKIPGPKVIDPHVSGPIAIRNLRIISNGSHQFDLHIKTSLGLVKTRGWLWSARRNLLRNPRLGLFPIVAISTDIRRALRNLFTRIMLDEYQIVVPQRKVYDQSRRREQPGATHNGL